MHTIAWDIDDVLNALMHEWFTTCWLPEHPRCRLSYEDIKLNPPHILLGVSLETYLSSLDAYRLSGYYAQLTPDPQIMDWFNRYGNGFRHVALTAVPRIAAPISAAWTIKHFGDWIRTFHFVPSPRGAELNNTYESTKVQFMQWIDRIDLFVDDHPGHVEAAIEAGIKSYLVSRPWNSGGMPARQILDDITSLRSSSMEKK